MSLPADPYFYAWADDAERVEAFLAALSALMDPSGVGSVSVSTLGVHDHVGRSDVPLREIVEVVRASFTAKSETEVYAPVRRCSGRGLVSMHMRCSAHGRGFGQFPIDPLVATSGYTYLCPHTLYVVVPEGKASVEVASAMLSLIVQEDLEHILGQFCAPDGSHRIPTGGFTGINGHGWSPPLELSATYNADGNIARDVALSWLHLHDGDRVGYIAGTPVDALIARVQAASPGATVGVATKLERVHRHEALEYAASHHPASRGTHVGAIRRVPRDRLPDDVDLTREQVLRILETPPATLLEALDAAAVPDDEWRAAEPLALQAMAAQAQGAPTMEVDVTSDKHRRFLQHHAPFHVRRLPNGGVLLATHPYRTLWPLWADALELLGIRTKGPE